jgi:hypothetical protein
VRRATEQGRVFAWAADKRDSLIVLLSLVAPIWVFPYSLRAQEANEAPPSLNSILWSEPRNRTQPSLGPTT